MAIIVKINDNFYEIPAFIKCKGKGKSIIAYYDSKKKKYINNKSQFSLSVENYINKKSLKPKKDFQPTKM